VLRDRSDRDHRDGQGGQDRESSQSEKWRFVGPEVGPTPAFSSCTPTGMHGPTRVFWANLTPLSPKRTSNGGGVPALPRGEAKRRLPACRCDALPLQPAPCHCGAARAAAEKCGRTDAAASETFHSIPLAAGVARGLPHAGRNASRRVVAKTIPRFLCVRASRTMKQTS
jgi:hypothetical protein